MKFKQWGLAGVIILLTILFTVLAPQFLSLNNLSAVLSGMAIVTIAALGITFSLSVDGFDLSVGSTITLTNTIMISLLVWQSWSIGLSIVVTLLAAVVVASINILLILYFKIPDLYATLATMFIVEGFALTYAEGGSISEGMTRADGSVVKGHIPAAFKHFSDHSTLIIVMIVMVLLAYLILKRTKYGRLMYMIGSNKRAAYYTGIRVKNYIALAYLLSSLCAGIGGILLASQVNSAQINSGSGYLMTAVAAAFIGATCSADGKPNAVGTLLGALLIAVLENGLVMLSVPYYGLNIVKGVVLAFALVINYYSFNKKGVQQ